MNQVPYNTVMMALQFDSTLTPADKRVLIDQLQRASMANIGGQLDITRLTGMGFTALVAYIISRVLGGGKMVSLGAAAVGGLMAGMKKNDGRTYDPRGFYTY